MCRSDSPVSRSVVIDDRTAVLILFRPLKDLSAEQLVTGRVHNILTKALMLGNMVVACLRVTVGLCGRLLYLHGPYSIAPTSSASSVARSRCRLVMGGHPCTSQLAVFS